MAYTPELSQIGSATLRRLAWYFGKPMTESLETLMEFTATKMAEAKPGEASVWRALKGITPSHRPYWNWQRREPLLSLDRVAVRG